MRVVKPSNIALLGSFAAAMSLAATVARADDTCYRDWSDAAPIVSSERLQPAKSLQEFVRREHGSDVVRIVLCRLGNGFVYRLMVRNSDGRMSQLSVDAQQPLER